MYVSPNHPEYERLTSPPAPIEDQGTRLATLPRHASELRVSLAEYQGRPYVSLRVWEPGAYDPGLYPTQKGVSVRTSELDHVISALEHAKSILEGEDPGGKGIASSDTPRDDVPRYIPKRGRPRPRILDPTPLRTAPGTGAEFDEFDECGNQGIDRDRDVRSS
jgi:hypothetical protein